MTETNLIELNSPKSKTKKYTEKQVLFLEYLSGEAQGDLIKAKELAGYGVGTSTREIVNSLKDEIIEIAKNILAMNSIKASMKLVGVLDNPTQAGAKQLISAVEKILDRSGIIKPEASINIQQGAVFIMPDKKPLDYGNG